MADCLPLKSQPRNLLTTMSVDLARQDLLKELEARQDDVLQQLIALEGQVEQALAEFAPVVKGTAPTVGLRLATLGTEAARTTLH